MASPRTTIIIIPGSYSPTTFYTEFKYGLLKAGYDVHLSDLPSASGAPPLPAIDLAGDAVHFRDIITTLADQGKTLVVLAHSYGGLVCRETLASAELSLNSRQARGEKGGISRIIYLSAMMSLPPANSMKFFEVYAALLPWLSLGITDLVDAEREGGPYYLRQNPIKAAPFFFNDLSDADAVKWMVRMSMQSMSSWTSETHVLGKDVNTIPTTFIKCLKDAVFPPDFQDEMVKLLNRERAAAGSDTEVDVKEVDSAHFPPVTMPRTLADLVDRILS